MNIATVVVTAPRRVPTLKETLSSIAKAKFEDPIVYNDSIASGQFRAYYNALKKIFAEKPGADAYLVFEDDIILCEGVCEYLEKTLWPTAPENIGFCSLYRPGTYRNTDPGWQEAKNPQGDCCCQAWIYPPSTVKLLLEELASKAKPGVKGGDYIVSRWVVKRGLSFWHHTPSLAEHIAPAANSVVGNNRQTRVRTSPDFPGKQFDAVSLLLSSEAFKTGNGHE